MVTTGPPILHAMPRPWALAVILLATLAAFSYLPAISGSPLASECQWQETPLTCATLPASPTWLRATNLGLHLANTTLALAIFVEWMPLLAALVAALWFGLHPLQAEAVTLTAGRPELLASLFALAALLAWRHRRIWIACASFSASLAAGPAGISLPVALMAVEVSLGGELRRGIRALQTMSLMAALASLWWIAHKGLSLDALLSAAPALGHQMKFLGLPSALTIWPVIDQSPASRFIAWMALAALTGAAFTAFRNLRLGFWFLIFLVMALPGFLLNGGPEPAPYRHAYLPMLAVAAMAGRVFESTRLPALLPAGAALLALLTFARGAAFQSEQALWEEAAQVTPHQLRPRLELARLAPPRRALEILLETRQMFPSEPAIAEHLAATYLKLNLPGDAINEFGRALAQTPGRADLHLGRGHALAALRLHDAALTDYELALAIEPCSAEARAALHLTPPESCTPKENRPRE